MRVSSLSFYTTTLGGIQNQQSSIARLSQQIASEKKYLATKDSPIETSRILQLADKISMRNQYQSNQVQGEIALKEEETVLNELETAIATARGVAMGTSGTEDQASRTQLAIQLNNLYRHIKDLANSQDSSGNYLFAGHQTDTRPYSHASVFEGASAPQATTYAGDAGIRRTEIDAGRYIQTNDNIDTVLKSGTGSDLLQSLDNLAVALRDGTATQTDLDNAYSLMTGALDSLRAIQSSVAGRQLEIAETQASGKALLNNDKDALGEVQDLDMAAAIIELQLRQVSLQAAENAFSLTAKQSLFNYL